MAWFSSILTSPKLRCEPPQRMHEGRFEGFEFLRVIFSIAIVALKTNLFLLIEILVSGTFAYALMAKVAYLAVPVFLQMALFLFYLKSEKVGFSYFLQKRLPRLLSLYIFWVGAKILFDIFVKGEIEAVIGGITSPRGFVEFIVSGGQSPFFFFFALIFLSTLAAILVALFKKLKNNSRKQFISYGLLVASCLLIFSFSITELVVSGLVGSPVTGVARSISSIAFWDYNPLSFLPYLFTSAIVTQEFKEGKLESFSSSLKLKLCGILSLSIFFMILEWHLFEKLLHYSRISLVLGSWLLLYLALLSPYRAPASIKFLSACSLGIYGFHVFFTHTTAVSNLASLNTLFQSIPGLDIVIGFTVTLVGSIVLTMIFKRIKFLKNYV